MATGLTENTGAHSTPLRERIVDAAAKVYGEFGFRGATTRRIAEEAGVNEVTLFRTFGSKAALIFEVLHRDIGQGFFADLPAVPVHPARELTQFARKYIDHARSHRGMIMQSMGEFAEHPEVADPICESRKREFEILVRYLDALRSNGLATASYDSVAAAAMLTGTLFSDAVGRELFHGTFPEPTEDAAEVYVTLLLRAIGVGVADSARRIDTTTGIN